jgi:predicted nucleotidyltransferase
VSLSKEAIVAIENELRLIGFKTLLMGATARDLIAEKFGIKAPIRKTSDIDFAVLVETWNDLEKIKMTFKQKNDFSIVHEEKERPARFYYKNIPFDIVPFGKLESDSKISWPPFYDKIMTVLGYREALENSIKIEVNGKSIDVISTDMLIALKIISWQENQGRHKDLTDIKYLIENYELIEPDSYMNVLENHDDIFSQFDFDADCSSTITIGMKILKIAKQKTKERLISILDSTSNINKMIAIMAPGIDLDGEDQTREQKRCRLYLNSLLSALKNQRTKF